MTNEEIELIERAMSIIHWDGYNSNSKLYAKECEELCDKLQEMIDKYQELVDT